MHRILLVLLLLLPTTARAADDVEGKLHKAVGKAFAAYFFQTGEDANAHCEQASALLAGKPPSYLNAYVEECRAIASQILDKGDKNAKRCTLYTKAIDIWRTSPPPRDDEDAALKRADRLVNWKDAAAKACGTPRPPKPALAIAVPDGAIVETQEGIAYTMPGGWTVRSYSEVSGHAEFKHGGLNYFMSVSRATKATAGYPNTETLANGRTIQWEHGELIKGLGGSALFAVIAFDAGRIYVGITSLSKDVKVDRDTAMTVVRRIAADAKVLGPRRCIGECRDGTVTPPAAN